MKFGVASWTTVAVCALAGSAWAAGNGKACLEGVVKACVEIGTAVANDERPIGRVEVEEMREECRSTRDEPSCAAVLREEVKASCRKGAQLACQTLGESEAQRIADETAPSMAELEASCKKKDQQACVDLALSLYRDEPSKKNLKRGLALLEGACKANIGEACARVGLTLMMSGKKSDAKRGEKLLKRACDLGSKAGCNFFPPQPKILKPGDKSTGPGMLGALGATEDVGQTMKNLAKLSRLLDQNCKLGYADACAELEAPEDPDPAKRKISTSAEIAAKIRKLEKQAAAGPAPKK